jgi:MFS family permease
MSEQISPGTGRPSASVRSQRCLDWLNFSVAAAQTGFGPFIGVYLTSHGWTQTDIGVSLSVGTVAAMASQLPAGALVDAAPSKTTIAMVGLAGVAASALLLAFWPTWLPVIAAQILHAFASSMLGPAIAAISLAVIGHDALGERLGHNTRYASIGNAAAAAALGGLGYYASGWAVFVFASALVLPGLAALRMMRTSELAHAAGQDEAGHDEHVALLHPKMRKGRGEGIGRTLLNRGLLAFCACAAVFYFSNAAMLTLAANQITQRAGGVANVFVAAAIIVPQIVVAVVSPWAGRTADRVGRRPLLLLGFAALPIRGLILAATSNPVILVMSQALDGISGAVFGVMVPLIAADVSRRSGRLNLSMGAIGLAIGLGATLSTTVAGKIADRFGITAAFLALALAGVAACAMLFLIMPETSPRRGRRAAVPVPAGP